MKLRNSNMREMLDENRKMKLDLDTMLYLNGIESPIRRMFIMRRFLEIIENLEVKPLWLCKNKKYSFDKVFYNVEFKTLTGELIDE